MKGDALARTFTLLEAAAVAGERCPQNAPHGPIPANQMGELARAGKVRIEVFRHNWRVVTILQGPHAGKQTKAEPTGATRPHMVVDHRDRKLTKAEQCRPGPSAPRRIA